MNVPLGTLVRAGKLRKVHANPIGPVSCRTTVPDAIAKAFGTSRRDIFFYLRTSSSIQNAVIGA